MFFNYKNQRGGFAFFCISAFFMSKLWDTKHLFYVQARFFMIFRRWTGKQSFHLCVRCFSFSFLFHPFTFCSPVLVNEIFDEDINENEKSKRIANVSEEEKYALNLYNYFSQNSNIQYTTYDYYIEVLLIQKHLPK